MNIRDTVQSIAKSILNVSDISSNNFTIFSSAIGSHRAAASLYIPIKTPSFIIGNIHIPTKTITPIIPTAFLSIALHPITVSTASDNILPTTGIRFDTAAFVVFAVIPSTVLLRVPSRDTIPINIVRVVPKYPYYT